MFGPDGPCAESRDDRRREAAMHQQLRAFLARPIPATGALAALVAALFVARYGFDRLGRRLKRVRPMVGLCQALSRPIWFLFVWAAAYSVGRLCTFPWYVALPFAVLVTVLWAGASSLIRA